MYPGREPMDGVRTSLYLAAPGSKFWASGVSVPLPTAIARAAALGYDAIEIMPRAVDDPEPDKLRTLTAQHGRSEEHTSELQSRSDLVCRLLLEKKTIKLILTPPGHDTTRLWLDTRMDSPTPSKTSSSAFTVTADCPLLQVALV